MATRSQSAMEDRQAVVLVLDDDPYVGEFVKAALPETNYRVVWRRTAGEAIRAAGEDVPDIAVVDIGLSADGSGFDFLRHLRAQSDTERIPVVMLTGSADTLDRRRSLEMGADRYLIKPVGPETLRRVLAEMLTARDDMWWTMTLRADQVERLRELFFDATTEVPTLAIVVDDLRKLVEDGERLQVFCLEIEPLFRVDERDHWDRFDALRREFVRGLRVMIAPILGNDVMIATSHSGANDFYCFARKPRRAVDPSQLAREIEQTARNTLKSIDADPAIADDVMIFAGAAVTEQSPLFAPRILYTAVREAKDNAERRETRYLVGIRERLARAVRERTITTVFQPVVDLRTRQIIGYEALSRGPAGSEVENPEVMFEMARDFDMVWDLEALCIENIRPWLEDVCARGYLFFNLESQFIQQLQRRGTDVFDTFFACRHQVVIEVTERSAIRDYRTFRRTLHDLKAMGFRIAIDDCGSGYATLEAVAELQPDYLKVGHSLFRDVERDPIRRRIVELVARCADTIGAGTIAEAIETEEQLRVCLELGIHLGQGFYFAEPAGWDEIKRWSGLDKT